MLYTNALTEQGGNAASMIRIPIELLKSEPMALSSSN